MRLRNQARVGRREKRETMGTLYGSVGLTLKVVLLECFHSVGSCRLKENHLGLHVLHDYAYRECLQLKEMTMLLDMGLRLSCCYFQFDSDSSK